MSHPGLAHDGGARCKVGECPNGQIGTFNPGNTYQGVCWPHYQAGWRTSGSGAAYRRPAA